LVVFPGNASVGRVSSILILGNSSLIALTSFLATASVMVASLVMVPLAPTSVPPCPASIMMVFTEDLLEGVCALTKMQETKKHKSGPKQYPKNLIQLC